MDTVTIIFETRGYLEFAFKPSETRRDGRVERLVTRMRLWDELFEVMIVGMGFFFFLVSFFSRIFDGDWEILNRIINRNINLLVRF